MPTLNVCAPCACFHTFASPSIIVQHRNTLDHRCQSSTCTFCGRQLPMGHAQVKLAYVCVGASPHGQYINTCISRAGNMHVGVNLCVSVTVHVDYYYTSYTLYTMYMYLLYMCIHTCTCTHTCTCVPVSINTLYNLPHLPPPSPQASAGSLDYSHVHTTDQDVYERRNSTDGKASLRRLDGGSYNGRRQSLERRSSSGDRNSATPDSFGSTYSSSHSPAQTPTSSKRQFMMCTV